MLILQKVAPDTNQGYLHETVAKNNNVDSDFNNRNGSTWFRWMCRSCSCYD